MPTFDIIEVVLIACAALWIGWRVHEVFIIHIIRTNPEILKELAKVVEDHKDELGTEEITVVKSDGQKVDTEGVEMIVEREGNLLYAYSKATNQFIAQGDTLENLLSTAHKRFPGKTFFGTLEEDNQNS